MTANKKQKVAVFDIDGTLFRSSLMLEALYLLVEKGVFAQEAIDYFEEEKELWMHRRGPYENYMTRAIEAYMHHIKGVHEKEIKKVIDPLLKNHSFTIYRYTRDLIDSIKDDYFMLAISHSPRRIVEPFARKWGFDKVYASIYATDDKGYFTGRVDKYDFIQDKEQVLKRAVETENLTLKDSIGVGDTATDIPFLKMVNRAIAFNPNQELYKEAKKQGWKIVVERKDVIYTINK